MTLIIRIIDSRPGGLPQPGTLEHTVTLGLFRLQQGLNQAALKLGEGPESLLQEGYSLLTGQQVATDKLGQAAQTSPSVSYSTLTNVNPTSVALGVLATGNTTVMVDTTLGDDLGMKSKKKLADLRTMSQLSLPLPPLARLGQI